MYHKFASHFFPDLVLNHTPKDPDTIIPAVNIAPNISITIYLKLIPFHLYDLEIIATFPIKNDFSY